MSSDSLLDFLPMRNRTKSSEWFSMASSTMEIISRVGVRPLYLLVGLIHAHTTGIWTPGLESADGALALFAENCFEAGPDVCAFQGNLSSADQVLQSVFDLLDAITKDPVTVPVPNGNTVVDFGLLKTAIFKSLYFPYRVYPTLAKGLADLKSGDGTTMSLVNPSLNATMEISNLDPDFVYGSEMQSEGATAVSCSDAGSAVASLDELKANYKEAANFSTFADTFMIMIEAACGYAMRCLQPH